MENSAFTARASVLERLNLDEDVARKIADHIKRLDHIGSGGRFPKLSSLLAKEFSCSEKDIEDSIEIKPGDMKLLVELFATG